ncbi:hypothetical protein MRB53_039640 [Persea americana]|nr:hypothetical protein MRB53_039640 [Persea americana]
MVEKTLAAQRQRPGTEAPGLGLTPGRTPTPRFTSAPKPAALRQINAAGLTPAARMLYRQIQTPKRTQKGEYADFGGGRVQKQSFTPTAVGVKKRST